MGPAPTTTVWAVNIAAYVVLVAFTVTADDPRPAFWFGLGTFLFAQAHFFWLRTTQPTLAAWAAWAGGLSALAWGWILLIAWT